MKIKKYLITILKYYSFYDFHINFIKTNILKHLNLMLFLLI